MLWIATSRKSIRSGIINNIYFRHRQAGSNGEIFDRIIKPWAIFLFDFFSTSHGDREGAGRKILDNRINRCDDKHPSNDPPIVEKISKSSTDGRNKNDKAQDNKDCVTLIGSNLFIHNVTKLVLLPR